MCVLGGTFLLLFSVPVILDRTESIVNVIITNFFLFAKLFDIKVTHAVSELSIQTITNKLFDNAANSYSVSVARL